MLQWSLEGQILLPAVTYPLRILSFPVFATIRIYNVLLFEGIAFSSFVRPISGVLSLNTFLLHQYAKPFHTLAALPSRWAQESLLVTQLEWGLWVGLQAGSVWDEFWWPLPAVLKEPRVLLYHVFLAAWSSVVRTAFWCSSSLGNQDDRQMMKKRNTICSINLK